MRVLIVDDEPDMLLLMRYKLTLHPELEIAGEAANGVQAIDAWQDQRPDVIVMDLRMPGISGLDAAEVILLRQPSQAIVMFSACLEAADRLRAAQIGVRECLEKFEFERLTDVLLRTAS